MLSFLLIIFGSCSTMAMPGNLSTSTSFVRSGPTSISFNSPTNVEIGSILRVLASNATRRENELLRPRRSASWIWESEHSAQEPSKNAASTSKENGKDARGYFTFLSTAATTSVTTTAATTTTISSACACVPYYLCDESQVIISGVIDIRKDGGPGCHSVLEVCCRSPRPTQGSSPTAEPTPRPPVTVLPGHVPRCGNLNPNGVNARILGFKDSETQYGEYPWMGAVLEFKSIRGNWVLQFLCGASLITPRVVLTAAHCVKGKRLEKLRIRLGEWDTQSTNEFYPYQELAVSEIVIHPNFYGGGLYNDIAVVFLRRSVVLAPNVDTICLPDGDALTYDPTTCWATGWGKNAFGPSGQYQTILREVELAITPNDICQSALRKTNLGPNFNLHPNSLCAGGQKDLDTCVGDGGGPLVCASLYDPWRYVLVGVISWGVSCGSYGVPGVYVDVPKFRNWIDSEILLRLPQYNNSRWTIPRSKQRG